MSKHWWTLRDCGCCEEVPPALKDPDNRARREREAMKIEKSAEKEATS